MFLKSLELNGFKSFAEKTTLEFPAGITAIVGPNGSGKSNVIDAVRWLLGERDAKSLRGARTEDLIWNGSPSRPRTSMAQASLHFDNGSGFFPIEAGEIAVARRLTRDGASEYFLNKSAVRLKDIVDLLSRARLGTKGLIIVSQGSSDLFVRATPEDRRMMIEEILGLREYELKKAESVRKLASTMSNLDKAKAMIQEVLPRLRLLTRQTNKWEKRQGIAEELRRLEDAYFGEKVGELDAAKEKLAPALRDIEESMVRRRKESEELQKKLAAVEKEASARSTWQELQKAKGEFLAKRSGVERLLARIEAKIEMQKNAPAESVPAEGAHLVGLVTEIRVFLEEAKTENDLSKVKNVIQTILARIEEVLRTRNGSGEHSADARLEAEATDLKGELRGIEDRIREVEQKEGAFALELTGFNDRFREAFEALESKREAVRALEVRKNNIRFEEEKIDLQMRELEHQMEQAGREPREFRGKKPARAEYSAPEIERKIFRLRAELAAIGEIDEALLQEASEVETHYAFLKTQSEDLERALGDLKALITELTKKIHDEFAASLKKINAEFHTFFRLMFGGGSAKLKIMKYELGIKNPTEDASDEKEKKENSEEREVKTGVEIELSIPKKRISNLDMLSGGEKSLVSIAALFALIAVSPPPFLVLDEVDAPLDETNSRRFANLIGEFSRKTQFIVVTHNRATMEVANVLYGITMGEDGCSRVLSVKLE